MDPSLSTDVDGEPKERKKIHFADPSTAPTNLDPRQVEMIRRRRPTPATLFRVADQGSPDEDQSTHQWVVGENGVLKPKRVNPNVYQPPSLRAVQKMAEAQMQHLGIYPPMENPYEGEEYDDYRGREEGGASSLKKATGHQVTFASDQSEEVSRVTAISRQVPAEEDEEEEEKEETGEEGATVGNSEETLWMEKNNGGL
ncbi:protein phosphatase 1 regulatory subunit 1B isoform X1 [Gadus chalcogrammus]|uniref:protein phosphatase 1 regulatory subunit 1B isoform X1 n=1 Tax=Gadus chalcogrammus TaxID=1042646 RepID=UPI0024C41F9F|nr:protein phosphatase 1 regulatory subunit 1B isoform X1 [Gadus chalcogrammus]XP_056436323.1 protein phosphatase 1 regulatory subunit 1B isoform X1 [Gadus chalcogrammus]